jgi:hypothetical protein
MICSLTFEYFFSFSKIPSHLEYFFSFWIISFPRWKLSVFDITTDPLNLKHRLFDITIFLIQRCSMKRFFSRTVRFVVQLNASNSSLEPSGNRRLNLPFYGEWRKFEGHANFWARLWRFFENFSLCISYFRNDSLDWLRMNFAVEKFRPKTASWPRIFQL